MDSLTHGLLGLALGSLRRGSRDRAAVLVGCVLAAEIPDLDYFWPADDSVLHSLRAHRGVSHSLLAAPVVALVSAALTKLVFRQAKLASLWAWTLAAVVFAHLLADAWTGWGTRLFLPFSDARVTLDWMMVVDPLFTLPLLVGALWGVKRRRLVRRAMLAGFAVSCLYLALRLGAKAVLSARVQARYPAADRHEVFPSWFGPTSWRYVAVLGDRYAVGRANIFGPVEEQAVHSRGRAGTLSPLARSNSTAREALAWARFPLLDQHALPSSGLAIRIADLRYHLNGSPTLIFELELDGAGRTVTARLERGGSARSLIGRFRGQ